MRAGTTPKTYFGDAPWEAVLRDFPDLDVMAIATPDHLHTEPVLAALRGRSHHCEKTDVPRY